MADWYYQVMGKLVGPVSTDEMRDHAQKGRIDQDTLIRKGDGEWTAAVRLKGLFDADAKPKLTDAQPKQPTAPISLIVCPFCSSKIPSEAANCPSCEAKLSEVKYIYRMQQLPRGIAMPSGTGEKGNEAAAYLEEAVNRWAKDGWEFYRVDEFSISLAPGCLAAIFGAKPEHISYYVATYRKLYRHLPAS